MSEILKPCPFCGNNGIDYVIITGTFKKIDYGTGRLTKIDYVKCICCGAEVKKVHNNGVLSAIEWWNTRANEEEEKMTNYEKIKNLTLEEMIEFIHCEGACNYCIYADDDNCKGLKCREGVKAWLNQEVTDNDEL